MADTHLTILLLSPLRKACGNHSTIQRIRSYLEAEKFSCVEADPEDVGSEDGLLCLIHQHGIRMIIALHAYKSGHLLSGKVTVPYVLIFGGTDINSYYEDERKFQIMTKAVNSARFLVAFSQEMMDRVQQLWPEVDIDRSLIIRQGIKTVPSKVCLRHLLLKNGFISNSQCPSIKILLFVGSIRPVKDPLFLVHTMKELHKERPNVYYVMIGPKTDEDCYKQFLETIEGSDGVIYIDEMSLEDVHGCMKDSFALVNTSESEGMAAVILEAMDLDIPVIARRNQGNESLIKHGVNGFLFSTTEEFKKTIESIFNNPDLLQEIVAEAKRRLHRKHSVKVEQRMYCDIVKRIMEES